MSDYLTEEEIANMVKAFNDMEIRPSASSPEEFKTWLEEYKDDDDALDAYIPRISTFTGDDTNAARYDIWRYEVLCLVKNRFTHETIKMAIRKSLKGNAAVIPMRLGVDATIDDIIDRMDKKEHNLGPKKETTPEKKSPIKPKQQITTENKQIQQLTARINQLITEIQAMRQNSDESNKEQIRWRRRDTYQQPDETILHHPLYHNKRKTPRSETICWRCKQPGRYAIECTVRLDHSRKTVRALNLQQTFVMEHTTNSDYDTKLDPRLIGSANEVTVILNGLTTKALLDTGIDVLEEEVRPVPEPRKPVPKPRLRRNQPQKELPTKVISDVETVTDSEDESFVVMWNEPENEKETDVIVPSDDEIDTVPDEIDVPGNVDDDQVRTSEPDSDSVEDAQDADDELQTQDQNEENDEANSFVQDAPVEESEEAEEDEEDEEEETSDNVVRRSTRTKISTATTKYKDFVAKSAQKTNWMIRAEYLKSAASSGIFSKYGDDVSKAMLQLITKSDD
ncbi:unnamed protein product [Mytilus edulis]|uniref:CCHC-type domain-containing protein n=1 Tax=Mytilus edulis TaxID=6550 RepID=A0A8S3PS00_MYTED|nr:unnamed protein product [Mytilus edulis]